jgi:hypothetical protein
LNSNTAPHSVHLDYVEHNEVPEGRVIHGHHMTFHAPVYGQVISDGGKIRLESSLGWGVAINPAGHIHSTKRAFNATLQAPGGIVEVASAESCLIIGREVRVLEAVKCQIFAHTLHVGTASGCMIAGRNMEIRHARPHKLEPNMITMVVPEWPNLDDLLGPLHAEIAEIAVRVNELTAQFEALKADTALSQYLAIRGKVRTGLLTLTDEQTQGYERMEQQLGDKCIFQPIVDGVSG